MTKITYKGKFLIVEQEKKKILAVGDLHLGFENALNEAGVFVNRYVFGQLSKDLEEIFTFEPKFDEIILLGDIKHSIGSILREERSQLETVIDKMQKHSKKIVIIKGNHDALLDYIVKDKTMIVKECYQSGDCVFLHGDKDHPNLNEKEAKYIIIGHLHPAVILRDGVKSEKYKCFLEGSYKGRQYIVVPSLSTNNEGSDPREFATHLPWPLNLESFNVIIVGEGLENYSFGKLKTL